MKQSEYLDFFNLKVNKVTYSILLKTIESALLENNSACITYANANTLNIIYQNKYLMELFSSFDIIHLDGFGVFFASKFLYGSNGFQNRITGSTFYKLLLEEGIKGNWKFFFFGDKEETLKKISSVHTDLKIVGYHNGFEFDNNKIIDMINNTNPDILIVGMGSPKQEKWIINSKNNLDVKIIIAVGDGIKVFSGIKKRGPKFLQKIGLEWLVRLFFEPKRLWRRYLIGIPVFILRIAKLKFFSRSH